MCVNFHQKKPEHFSGVGSIGQSVKDKQTMKICYKSVTTIMTFLLHKQTSLMFS
jgi:hypothetical protein